MKEQELKTRVLVVEDAKESQILLRASLCEKYHITMCATKEDAMKMVEEQSFDLAILDILLPDGTGYEVCSKLQMVDPNVPIIFLSSKTDPIDKVMAFKLGAEDYLTKPFHKDELLVRIEARLKTKTPSQHIEKVEDSNIRIIEPTRTVEIYELGTWQDCELTKKEYLLFEMLYSKQDQIFSRDQIIDRVWGNDIHINDRTVDSHLSKLRKKLGSCGDSLKSVSGFGYKFQALKKSA